MTESDFRRAVLFAWGGFACLHVTFLAVNWSSYYFPETYVLYFFLIHALIIPAVFALLKTAGFWVKVFAPFFKWRQKKKSERDLIKAMMHSPQPLEIKLDRQDTKIELELIYPYNVLHTAGWTPSVFYAEPHGRFLTFDLARGKLIAVYGSRKNPDKSEYSILHLTPFETVNSHHWNARGEVKIGGVREGAKWEIMATDMRQASRFLVMQTHAPKDKVFEAQMKLGQVLTYAQSVISPFAAILEAGKTIPQDELREIMKANPPSFGWA